eukprot:COSAG05_NODE_3515_length_2016_cov_1.772040_2_plen_162_part_00
MLWEEQHEEQVALMKAFEKEVAEAQAAFARHAPQQDWLPAHCRSFSTQYAPMWPHEQLRCACSLSGLDTSGSRAQLAMRLAAAHSSAISGPAPQPRSPPAQTEVSLFSTATPAQHQPAHLLGSDLSPIMLDAAAGSEKQAPPQGAPPPMRSVDPAQEEGRR